MSVNNNYQLSTVNKQLYIMFTYELDFKVRDYECDLQGIVNNSVYQNYLEHTRHEFLLDNNVSFDLLHQQGVDAVVARIEMAYKTPLKSGDEVAFFPPVTGG